MKRRTLLNYMPFGAIALMECAQAATKTVASATLPAAAATRSAVAAPSISASQMLQGLLEQYLLPSSTALLHAAQALARSLATPGAVGGTGGPDAAAWARHRPLWVNTMLAWETLAAVAVGPLLLRRTARTIDFWPTRPAQIRLLLQNDPRVIDNVQQLETVGSGARGLPALEWLLWKTNGSGRAQPYAALLAQQIEEESAALLFGYELLANADKQEADAWALYSEWFGQALGGLNQLRIKKMVIDTRGKDSSVWVRGISGQTAACWQAQAQGLQAFLLGSPTAQAAIDVAKPGFPVTGSLNSLLLGRGHITESKTLLANTRTMLRAVQAASPSNAASVRAAQSALAQLSGQANRLASDVLNITMSFTDADGD